MPPICPVMWVFLLGNGCGVCFDSFLESNRKEGRKAEILFFFVIISVGRKYTSVYEYKKENVLRKKKNKEHKNSLSVIYTCLVTKPLAFGGYVNR
jgi:hypothetical protein